MLNDSTCVMALKKLKMVHFWCLMTLQEQKMALQIWPFIPFLAPSTSALFTLSGPLLLQPLLHLLGSFYCGPLLHILGPLLRPFLHLDPSTTAPSTPSWPHYYGPFSTFLALLLGPLLHLFGSSTRASSTPSWPLLLRPLLHYLGHSTVASFYTCTYVLHITM